MKGSVRTGGRPAPQELPLGQLHSPLRDQVMREIRHAIIAGRYKPGERLVEDRLARDFGVSRNPVREALRALAAEGIVEVAARRGATVAAISRTDAREMVEVRATLEGLNARLAARRRDPEVLPLLEDILQRGTAAAAGGRPELLRDLNARFHDALAAAGRNRVLGDLMRTLRDRTSPVFAAASAARARRSWDEHAAILQAVIAGDEDLACLLAMRHVNSAGAEYLESVTAAVAESD